MSKIKLLSIAVIGLLFVNLGLVAFLFFRKPPHTAGGRPPLSKDGPKKLIIERLHLDKEQVTQYEHIIEVHQAGIKSLDDSIKIAKNNLYQSLTDENFTSRDSLIARLGLLQRKIELTHYDHFAAIRKICNPEQLAYFNGLTKDLAKFFAPIKKEGRPPKD